ncbi:hypothetical protein ACLB2K_055629 [Fragaria x ananassa]
MFHDHLGKIIKVYVDDMLVKSVKAGGHVVNLKIIFEILLKYKMRLNPDKCFFGITSSKFMRYMISERVIEANLEKIKAILDMKAPVKKKDVEVLQGRLTSLSFFISRLTDACVPFFKAMKRPTGNEVDWTLDCQAAF